MIVDIGYKYSPKTFPTKRDSENENGLRNIMKRKTANALIIFVLFSAQIMNVILSAAQV